jgi:hypothetical protein
MAQFCKVETDKTKTKHTAGDQECADIITHTPHSLILLLFYYIQQIDSMYLYILKHLIIYRMVCKV